MFTQPSCFQGKSQPIEQPAVTKISIIVGSWSASAILDRRLVQFCLRSSFRPYNLMCVTPIH